MKIHRISVDVSKFQWLIPQIQDSDLLALMQFDCTSRLHNFTKVPWYVQNPAKVTGNFFHVGPGAIGFDRAILNSDLLTLMEMSGEILEIEVEEIGSLFILNVMECVNCLDKKLSKIETFPNGNFRRIEKYSFHVERLVESPLFKIPETSRTEILTLAEREGDEIDFKSIYELSGFKGLIFEELWIR